MQTESEVQDNIIPVPFRMLEVIYNSHRRGIDHQSIAIVCGTTESVISTVVKFQHRKALRTKYLIAGGQEPA